MRTGINLFALIEHFKEITRMRRSLTIFTIRLVGKHVGTIKERKQFIRNNAQIENDEGFQILKCRYLHGRNDQLSKQPSQQRGSTVEKCAHAHRAVDANATLIVCTPRQQEAAQSGRSAR